MLPVGEVGDNVEEEVELDAGVEDDDELQDPGPTTSARQTPGSSSLARQAPVQSTSTSCREPPVSENVEGSEGVTLNGNSKRTSTPNNNAFRIKTKRQEITLRDKVLVDKWSAQTDVMRQQEYNLKLQNWKLEQELGIIGSPLTAGIKPLEVKIVIDLQ